MGLGAVLVSWPNNKLIEQVILPESLLFSKTLVISLDANRECYLQIGGEGVKGTVQ